jgi:hypothetical protein
MSQDMILPCPGMISIQTVCTIGPPTILKIYHWWNHSVDEAFLTLPMDKIWVIICV